MKITVKRSDPMAGIPDSHAQGVLSHEEFDSWNGVFDSLRKRNIPLTDAHEAEFRAHPMTDFQWPEFIQVAGSAYMCNVQYVVQVSE